MNALYDCTGFQRDCLQAIAATADGVPYGLALKEYLDERYPEPINHSRLYQNLDQLVEADLVVRDSLDERTNAYRLTDAGRRQLTQYAEDLGRVCDHDPLAADGGER